VQNIYIRRRFFGWGLQLRLSEGLLLSSAGLLAALLLYTAARGAATDVKWKAPSSLASITLTANNKPATKAPVFLLASEPRPYLVATTGALRSLAAIAPGPAASEPAPSPDQAPQTPPTTVKATVQRSWTIIKLAFR